MLKPKKNEIRKPTKTISGVTPIAVMLPPRKCKHGTCLYCPSLNVPQSYTPKSPAVLRASQVNYKAYEQIRGRIKAFEIMNHPTDKIELIIMGGTFLEYPKKFQYEFIKRCYDALNGKSSSKDTVSLGSRHKNPQAGDSGEPSVSLERAEKLNENSKHRCVALCVETRPDVCVKYIDRLREFGCTRVELGVQIIDDEIYQKIKRGHTVKDVVEATKVLRNAGFKVGYHIMPGLPGSNVKKDLDLFKKLFSDERFKPEQLKIYPCQVLEGSGLEKVYWKGKYKPYTKEKIEKVLIQMLKIVPRYCRVMRIMREIPPEYLVAGTTRIDLRKEIEADLRQSGSKLKEIRFREVGFANKEKLNRDLKLKITKYKASGGEEYFLEIVGSERVQASSLKNQERNKNDILFGLLRLRIYKGVEVSPPTPPRNQLTGKQNCVGSLNNHPKKSRVNQSRLAIIRELHVYGKAIGLGKLGEVQHRGLGKWLMSEAEKIVKRDGIKELSVISGVGVRKYYRKLGYRLKGTYMVKKFE